MDVQIGRGEQTPGALGPFNQNDGIFLEDLSEPGIQPFTWIAKSIEIKVIEV